jgi:hypothetical protein
MKTNANTNINVSLGKSRFGTIEPQAELRCPRGTHYRAVRAAILMLAAKVEMATPAEEGWIVQVDASADDRGRVYLELATADESEARRGIELLRKVVG